MIDSDSQIWYPGPEQIAGANVSEIARRSGVSVPVVYDHFASKKELHQSLLERHFAQRAGCPYRRRPAA